MKKLLLLVFFFLTACATPEQSPTLLPDIPAIATSTLAVLPSPITTENPTATPIPTIAPTLPPILQPGPTPIFVLQGPGTIVCPILLYHRIETPAIPNEYYVSPENFHAQMQALKDWGYTPIPISLLLKAIKEGAPIPERPVVITFDDGDITVYTTAFPVMQEFGFVGVNYLVGNRLNAEGFMRSEHLLELAKAGWEVGSHSMTHADLTQSQDPFNELFNSRVRLEDWLGLPVETFAYPFGLNTDAIKNTVSQYYSGAVGLGAPFNQGSANLYYLWRRPVKYEWDLETFGSFLPWNTAP